MKLKYFFNLLLLLPVLLSHAQVNRGREYQAVQTKLQSGWGTYNHKSVLSHVLLPHGIALNIGIKRTDVGAADNYLREAFISSRDVRTEMITPGYHAPDGSYTALTVQWQGIKFIIETAHDRDSGIVILLRPEVLPESPVHVVLEAGMLWNKPGSVSLVDNQKKIQISAPGKKVKVNYIGDFVQEYIAATTPYVAVKFDKEVAFFTGEQKSIADVKAIIAERKAALVNKFVPFGGKAAVFEAINNVISWNVIYDAAQDRVIYPVSRIWNDNFGGQSVLFCWDTYFSAYMASMLDKNLAYANAIEITKSITPGGFVPNWSGSYGNASFDRSQPPVGSLVFKELYRKYQEKWVLEYVFDDLLKWNRWWEKNRDNKGLLCYGSNPVEAPYKGDYAAHAWQGAAFESLDNSPMYDRVPFNKSSNMLELADVGLMSYYIMDCATLAEIAMILHKPEAAKELKRREEKYRKNISRLWNEKAGIYMNYRTDLKEFSTVLTPTNFYPLLVKVPTAKQAKRMVDEHLLNPNEFYSEWMLPSVAINDSTFKEQDYWRGRIWAPMNFLVYLGLLNYEFPETRRMLVEKSEKLMMDNVKIDGWIFENYNAITGNVINRVEGRRKGDNYYHWGGLLGFISLIEEGYVKNPWNPIYRSTKN